MSLLDLVDEKYGPPVRTALAALTALSQPRAAKAVKAVQPKPEKSQVRKPAGDPVSVDMLRRQLLRERRGELQVQAAGDWDDIKADIGKLLAFADLEAIRLIRESGNCPDSYTAKTTCRNCGEVPIFEGCPPQVNGCPWCLNRHAGLPMPKEKTSPQ